MSEHQEKTGVLTTEELFQYSSTNCSLMSEEFQEDEGNDNHLREEILVS